MRLILWLIYSLTCFALVNHANGIFSGGLPNEDSLVLS